MSGNTVTVTDASFDDDVLRAGRLTVAKLNVDENPATADAYQVQSIPLMGVFSGGELVKSNIGAQPKTDIMDELAEFLR